MMTVRQRKKEEEEGYLTSVREWKKEGIERVGAKNARVLFFSLSLFLSFSLSLFRILDFRKNQAKRRRKKNLSILNINIDFHNTLDIMSLFSRRTLIKYKCCKINEDYLWLIQIHLQIITIIICRLSMT